MKTYHRGQNYCTYIFVSRFYNQINFFITLINGGNFDYCGDDFDKCGGDIDGGDFAEGRFDLNSPCPWSR